jgi:hypothetical protein
MIITKQTRKITVTAWLGRVVTFMQLTAFLTGTRLA